MHPPLPRTLGHLLIRTDFADQDAWAAIRSTIDTPTSEGFLADVELLEDPAYQEISIPTLIELAARGDYDHLFLMVADHSTMRDGGYPILVVHLSGHRRGETLRVIASQLWSIQNNLAVANMDWEEFVAAADQDGVFRGF